MRRAARVDANHTEIVAALRAAGCSVSSIASVGGGLPDLVVGRAGMNYLLEVKDGAKSPSARRLTGDELVWHENWRGSVETVYSVQDALEAVGLAAA